MARLKAAALLAALLFLAPLLPSGVAHTGVEPEAGGGGGRYSPWNGHTLSRNYTEIPLLSFEKGQYFVYQRQVYDSIEEKQYSVLDVTTLTVNGTPRDVILYGFDNNDVARGARNAYIEYRDAHTFDLIKVHEFGYSTDNGHKVGRDVLKEFSPPYREASFPMVIGTNWSNNVTVKETRTINWVDPVQGPKEVKDSQLSRVVNRGLVTQVVNLTIAGTNITTFQSLTLDGFTNRSDRHNWMPNVPVPVRIVRYKGFGAEATPLESLKLLDFTMRPIPEVAAVAEPQVTRVFTPVSLSAVGSDPGQRIYAYAWGFGDPSRGAADRQSGTLSQGHHIHDGKVIPTVTHSWSKPGNYTVKVVLAVSGGFVINRTVNVTVLNDPPVAVFTPPGEVPLDTDVLLDATDSYDREGPITGFRWTFTDGITLDGPLVTRRFSAPETSGILTLTDSSGSTTVRQFTVTASPDGAGSNSGAPQGDNLGPTLAVGFQEVPGKRLWANLTAVDPDGVAYVMLHMNGIPQYSNKTPRAHAIAVSDLKVGTNVVTASAWDRTGAKSTQTFEYVYTPPKPVDATPKPWIDQAGGVPKAGGGEAGTKTEGRGWFFIPAASIALGALAVLATALATRRRQG